MEITVAVCFGNFIIIDLGKPVVCGDSAAVGKNETADGIGDGGVFLYSPVGDVEILVNGVTIVKHRGLDVAQLFTLTAIENVCLGNVSISCLNEHGFDAVLNIFNCNEVILDLRSEIGRNLESEQIQNIRMAGLILSLKCKKHCAFDFTDVKIDNLVIAFYDTVHGYSSS